MTPKTRWYRCAEREKLARSMHGDWRAGKATDEQLRRTIQSSQSDVGWLLARVKALEAENELFRSRQPVA